MKSRILPVIIILLLTATFVSAQEYSFAPDILEPTANQQFGIGAGFEFYYTPEITSREFIDFGYSSENFGFITAFSFNQDDKYAPDIGNFPDGTLLGSYFTMDQGGMVFRGLDMELQLGRMEHKDAVDSPYSLFVSSKRMPALIANFRYENDFAFYETRWIELNERSSSKTLAFPDGFPDRGASFKTYGVKLGTMRFGFQDAAVYTGRSFDLEYLVSPMPNYLIQYVKGTAGRPWSTGSNENNIMGFFWDWKPVDALYLDAQAFIDDLNVFGLGDTPWNPWKAAYSVGGRWTTDAGRFSLHHAIATKYCFSTTSDSSPLLAYPWAYYPDTRYNDGSGYRSILVEDSMIGYYNGENNIAFRADYDATWYGIDLTSNLEFVLSGPKSPANAWHSEGYQPGTKLFDYSILEKKLVLTAQASRRVGDFVVFLDVRAGVAINALELQEPYAGSEADTGINANAWIWRPGATSEYILNVGLGARYDIPVMKALLQD